MAKSGGDKSKDSTGKAGDPNVDNYNIVNRTIPAFQPGAQGLLAQQLAAGGYGDTASWNGLFNDLYQPMTLPVINGAMDIAKLRAQLKAAGINTSGGSTTPTPSSSENPGNGHGRDKGVNWRNY